MQNSLKTDVSGPQLENLGDFSKFPSSPTQSPGFIRELVSLSLALIVVLIENMDILGFDSSSALQKLAGGLTAFILFGLGWKKILHLPKNFVAPEQGATAVLAAVISFGFALYYLLRPELESSAKFETPALIMTFVFLADWAGALSLARINRTLLRSATDSETQNQSEAQTRFFGSATSSSRLIFWVALIISLGAFIFWWKFKGDQLFAVNSLVATLAIASPFAFIASAQSILRSSLTRLQNLSCQLQSAEAIENIGEISQIAFNKTGIITHSNFLVSHIFSIENISHKEVLQWAASAEQSYSHPLASALEKSAKADDIKLLELKSQNYEVSKGIKAEVLKEDKSHEVLIGNLVWLYENGFEPADLPESLRWESEGSEGTVLWLAVDRKILGILVLEVIVTEEANAIIRELQSAYDLGLITGDAENVSEALAKRLQLKFHHHSVGPDEKPLIVKRLQEKKKKGIDFIFPKLAYIGDGYLDEKALKEAHLSIALSETNVPNAQLRLLPSAIENLPLIFDSLEQIHGSLRRNRYMIYIYHFLALLLTIGVLKNFGVSVFPPIAAAASSICLILVYVSALRLIRD